MGACTGHCCCESEVVVESVSDTRRYTSERKLEDDYIVDEGRVLGSGMNGAVKMAVGRHDRCTYAVKSFWKASMSASDWASMREEMQIFLSLDHPHVARLDMVYETKEAVHIVMEHLEGGELFDRVSGSKDSRFTEDVAAEAARQMCLAIAYLHESGVAHRDLKMENFLFEAENSDRLKLIDFGLSSRADKDTRMSTACGSLQYVAPEVLAKSYTKQADMWSLGVVVYMMLVGRMLWNGGKSEVQAQIRRGELTFSPRFDQISETAQDFVKSLLVVDERKRMTAQKALSHPWLTGHRDRSEVPVSPVLLGNLQRYAKSSQFQRGVHSLMAWSLPARGRELLEQHFLAMDKDRSGSISLEEFTSALSSRVGEESLSEEEAEELFKRLDADGNGQIQYSEFLAAAMPEQEVCNEGTLRRTFARFDLNRDGNVSMAELSTVLGDSFACQEIEELFEEADSSGDGRLGFDDFAALVRKPESPRPEA